jgi:glyoxylate reductase
MHVVYTKRSAGPDPGRVDLDELLERSHVVSLHCPLTPETRHLIDADALDRMRDDAYLVNTARGPVVDEAALAAALRDGVIAGAENAVLVPHLGSATVETRTAMAELAAANAIAVLAGERPPTPVLERE